MDVEGLQPRLDPAQALPAGAVRERQVRTQELRRAIVRDELRVYYQPLVALATGRIVGVEALIRWQHPQHGLLPPAAFVPLAEATGLIQPLSRWMLTAACTQAARWRERLADATSPLLSVNLAPAQCRETGLVAEIAAILDVAGLVPNQLQLEITESAVLVDSAATRATMRGLRDLGARVVLDDFGTGYSSLVALKQFPLDGFKIDRAFVAGLGRDRVDTALVRSLLALGSELELNVTAEGVETGEQLARLRAFGCAVAQGYYFAAPSPPAKIEILLARGHVRTVASSASTRPSPHQRAATPLTRQVTEHWTRDSLSACA